MAIADISKAYSVVYKALDYRSIRQDMIASNIANVDTPFYRPKDVNFEQYLARENKKIFGNAERSYKLDIAKTSPRHLDSKLFNKPDSATFFWRDGHMAKNDANSVDLDVETSEIGKNSTMYFALTSALKRHKGIFSYAIDSGRNI